MSTRGYLTIVDESKNIQMAAFHPHDSYPSYLGLEVLKAIQNCAFPQLIDDLHQKYPDELEMVEGIQRSWYIRGKDNKDDFFYDYAYELNGSTQELTMYHYGNKALTIPFDQIPLFQYLFEREDDLYYPLCLDERSMTLKKDFYKEVRTMIQNGAGIDDFQAVIDQNLSVLYLDYGRIKDYWAIDSNSFNKRVKDSSGGELMFHVDESFGRFQIYVQTPFIRAPISHKPIQSASAAEKLLAELVRDRPDDIRATMRLFKDLTSYVRTIWDIYANDSVSLDDRADEAQEIKLDMLAKFKAIQDQYQIMGNTDNLLEREIKDVGSRHYRQAYYRMEEQQQKSSLSDKLQDVTERSQADSISEQEATNMMEKTEHSDDKRFDGR